MDSKSKSKERIILKPGEAAMIYFRNIDKEKITRNATSSESQPIKDNIIMPLVERQSLDLVYHLKDEVDLPDL